MARAWLQHLRDSALYKVEGLRGGAAALAARSDGQLARRARRPPGLRERLWIRAIFAGEPMDMGWRAHMFELPEGWGVEEAVAFYRAETALVDAVLDGAASFDLPSSGNLRPTTLRWAVYHLIEETARHVGHMDLTRELLDGRIGR